MAAKELQLKIVTPERTVLEAAAGQVSLPTTQGEITVLPNHIPLVASLASGDIVAMVDGQEVPVAVVGGFVEVADNAVTVLADFAEAVADLTDEEIEKARARAEELRQKKIDQSEVDFEHFEAELERSLTRVRIADKWRQKKYRA